MKDFNTSMEEYISVFAKHLRDHLKLIRKRAKLGNLRLINSEEKEKIINTNLFKLLKNTDDKPV